MNYYYYYYYNYYYYYYDYYDYYYYYYYFCYYCYYYYYYYSCYLQLLLLLLLLLPMPRLSMLPTRSQSSHRQQRSPNFGNAENITQWPSISHKTHHLTRQTANHAVNGIRKCDQHKGGTGTINRQACCFCFFCVG